MQKKLIGYASGWGAKRTGSKDGPLVLQQAGLAESIEHCQWLDIYTSPLEQKAPDKVQIITDYCIDLCEKVAKTIKENEFPITIGGDHTMAIGTWSGVISALNAEQNFGLMWIDAHMDAHTPQTSHSGSYHGMPLACLLGYGDEPLLNIGSPGAKLKPEHVCLIGIRSFENEEAIFLKNLGVRIFFMNEIRARGMDSINQEAMEIVNRAKGGYGISLDIDVFDPKVAPGTGSLSAHGFLADEMLNAMKFLSHQPNFKALEIAEFNPNMDKNGITLKLIFDVLKVSTS